MKKELLGTWVSEVGNGGWGPMICEYTFREDLSVIVVTRDPNDSEEGMDPHEGRYELDGEGIVIVVGKPDDLLRGEIRDGVLLIRGDDLKPVVFRKAKTDE